MPSPVGILEVATLTGAMLALDAMEKAGDVRVIQAELNDLLGVCIKVTGTPAALDSGMAAAKAVVSTFKGSCVTHVIRAPAEGPWPVTIDGPREFSPLLEADIVFFPNYEPAPPEGPTATRGHAQGTQTTKERTVSDAPQAIGFIETQGYTAVIEAIDSACKAGNVQVLGREKLGGGYITVVIQGDVAAVKAAVEAGQARVGSLGKLIAAHVIARPSRGVLGLLPKT
jgi:microcompartment protein CcmL/EutN